jgi:hypothetical protein
MGLVHEAEDRVRGRRVALKSLSRLDPAGIARLKNEFRALADVVHPNLVRLHDLHADDGLWLFAMELVEGEPFDLWVRPDGALDAGRLHRACAQLVAGVEAIHAAGKLHRDLKPDNVLVTAEGRVVILDFGLVADPVGGGVGQTSSAGFITGTPGYMAPEQAAGRPATRASDWYQVGVMIFEGLTGALPFEGSAERVMDEKQVHPAPEPGPTPDAAEGLARLCRGLLQRRPQDRPSIEAIRSAVGLEAVGSSSLPIRAAASAPSLVGRDQELAVLQAARRQAEGGEATIVHVVAESGMGKTALVHHFLKSLRQRPGTLVLSGRCYERENLPYNAFDRLVDALTRHLLSLPALEVAELTPRHVRSLTRVFPVLARVERFASAPARPPVDDTLQRRRAWDALVELLGRLCDRHPVVLHVDDAQWMDDDSAALFEHLCRSPVPPPVLLVACHRGMPRWTPSADAGGVAVRTLELAALPEQAGRTLAGRLLAPHPSLLPQAAAVAAEAGGNPFLITELARSLRQALERGAVGRVSLDAAIAERTGHLSRTARGLLDLIAVSGRPVPLQVVVGALHAREDPHGELDLLCTQQLARREQDGRLECHHDRIRAAVTVQLDGDARRQLHARLAEAWGALNGADPEVLFEHHHAAGNSGAAARWATAAADKAAAALAFERAAAFYRRAIEATPSAEVDALGLRQRLAETLSLGGRWREAGFAFAESAEREPRRAQRIYLTQQAARHLLGSGHSAAGMPLLRRAFDALGVRWPRTRPTALVAALLRLLALRVRGARHRLAPVAAPPRFHSVEPGGLEGFPSRPGARPAEPIALEALLDGAGLLPPYDLARGLYFIAVFAGRALAFGERSRVAVALAMLASLMSASRFTRRFGQRLASRAEAVIRGGTAPELGAAALGFVGFARLLDGRLEAARGLGAEGVSTLREQRRAHAYQLWAAQSVESFALMLMGRVGDAARLSSEIGREARQLGDEMAAVGGESVMGRLVHDDVEGAERLLRDKARVLERAGRGGALHQIVTVERICHALYRGRGHEMLELAPGGVAAALTPFDLRALMAGCALQTLRGEHCEGAVRARLLRIVRRARASLSRGGARISRGMVAQLDAALCLARGDRDGAVRWLARAADHYGEMDMELHRQLMHWRRGHLLDNDEGRTLVQTAEAFMRAQSVARPEGWARLLAPGLERGPRGGA